MKQYKNPRGAVATPPQYVYINGVPFAATDTMLKKAGWEIEDIQEPEPEPTAEELFEQTKAQKIADIEAYDTSEAVNGFEYNGKTMWIDKATRVGLVNAANAVKASGGEEITVGISGISVTLAVDALIGMLYQLEIYALACYNVTLSKKKSVETMKTMEDIEAMDITDGYPERLVFKL